MMRLKAEFTGGVIALLLVAGLVFAPGTPLGKVSQAQVAATPRATVAPTKEPAPETAPSEGDPVSSQLDWRWW